MTEIRFYHLQRSPLEQVLPQLLGKTLERNLRTVVLCGSEERVETLNQHLWTYNPASFLPHGSAADGHAEEHPIWLTAADENPNGATVLMLTDGATSSQIDAYALCCEIFDGNDEDAVLAARTRWKTYKDAEHALSYWQQTDKGWEQKA